MTTRRALAGRLGLAVAVAWLLARGAEAGMPAFLLAETAELRIQVLSFFLVVFLLLSMVVQRLWNGLSRDFTGLPRLSYKRALALVALWGLAFNLVLAMIAGARELMTPGAWVRDGATYRLSGEPSPPPVVAPEDQ